MKELNNFKKFLQENELHEGTWSLGSPEQINDIINGLQAIIKMADDAENKKNAAGRGFVDGLKNQLKDEGWNSRIYRIVGDDSFHDAYDNAKAAAELNDFDRVKNGLGDAIARAAELRDTILKNRGLEEGEELEENDKALDEMAGSMGIFKEIDAMVGSIKDQMNPDDAFDSLVSEFEAISGGTKLLHRALKNISLDNNLMEEKDEE